MTRQAISLVSELSKEDLGSYMLKKFEATETLGDEIAKIFGLQSYKDKIVSIDFTRHEKTEVSDIKVCHILLIYRLI